MRAVDREPSSMNVDALATPSPRLFTTLSISCHIRPRIDRMNNIRTLCLETVSSSRRDRHDRRRPSATIRSYE
jgi:hypothetical protein